MRSPQSSPRTFPLVIRHQTLSTPARGIPIPTSPSLPGGRAGLRRTEPGPSVNREGSNGGDEDADMDIDMDMDSPPALTTAQSLDEGDVLLTPPSHLLFGHPAPLSAAKGAEGFELRKSKEQKSDVQEQSNLMQAPPEILHRILCYSASDDVKSIARAAATCRELRSFIYRNPDQALWRDIHLDLYDDPRSANGQVRGNSVDWKERVQNREMMQDVFSWDEDRYDELPDRLDLICETLMDMYLDMPSLPDPTRVPPADVLDVDMEADSDSDSDSDSEDMTDDRAAAAGGARAEPDEIDEPLNQSILTSYLSSPTFEHLVLHCATRETKPLLRPIPGRLGSPLRRTSREIINPNLSRLHCLLPPSLDRGDKLQCDYRGFVRELVYSSQHYQERNEWAPLDERGRVDWRLVDAISTVMMANAKDVIAAGEPSWVEAVKPLSYGLAAVRSWGVSHVDRPLHLEPSAVWDWAGVEGRWCGSYAFLDYSDWIALNEPRIVLLRRSMADLDLAHYTEAVGDLLHMQLELVNPVEHAQKLANRRIGATGHSSEDLLPLVRSSLPTSDRLPPIHFKGLSAQASGGMTHPSGSPHSSVRGVVQLTADDPPQVRWTVVIRYTGADRWKIEGVQVGGRGSKRGFFGVWTDAEKEEHSPNGPTWYWKA